MNWPKPKPGLVVRYSYLWAREADQKREEGSKDRPCAVVLVVGDRHVAVLPITHARPADGRDGVELPPPVKRRLGLDDEPAWIIVSESNEFRWPGPDLRFASGGGPESAVYGMLPANLTRRLRDLVVARIKAGQFGRAPRTE